MTTSGNLSDEACFAAIKAALDAGCNYLNSGEFYGPPERNSLTLLRTYFEKYPEDADRAVVNIKGALGPHFVPNGTREAVTASVENVLKTLGPAKRIDQFEAARKDPKCDYEKETLETLDAYLAAGKIGGIACSEINADTIRSAARSFKITAVELELSLFSTEPLTNGTLEACAELGIPVLAYYEQPAGPPPPRSPWPACSDGTRRQLRWGEASSAASSSRWTISQRETSSA